MQEAQDDVETNTATERPRVEPPRREDLAAPAQQIGRFVVLGRVGAGGMGQVYSAYDPVLDRRVALKLLHAEQTEKDRDALVREAKALARLSHPNVVAVHDVGVHEGLVFLAMEFVEGMTLKSWLLQPREGKLPEAVALLLQAGRGLRAAHEAGLVHGDFKPHNVLVGEDGRVRVVDFGLARGAQANRTQRATATDRTLSDSEASAEDSRRVIVGTPAYMAPEHARRGTVDARTDQYSFCVAAWEVLHGVRPPEVAEEVEIPAVLDRALKKGLADRALLRHRSMGPLLSAFDAAVAELRGDRSRRVLRWTAMGGGAGLLVAVAAGYSVGRVDDDDGVCTGAESELAEVWNDALREEVGAAILATQVPYAVHTEEVVRDRLDEYAGAWLAGHTDACEANVVRQEQSAEVMDARMRCLDQRRRELRAAVGVLRTMDEQQVENAVRVVDGLVSPQYCEDLVYVQSGGQVPAGAELRGQVDEVRAALADVAAFQRAGRYEDARAGAEEAVATAKELRFLPLQAEAQLHLGRALDMLGKVEESIEAAKQAFLWAQTGGDVPVAMDAARVLSLATGVEGSDKEHGLQWNDIALALARRVEPEGGPEVASVFDARGGVLARAGKYAEAQMAHEQALMLRKSDSRGYAGSLASRGHARVTLGETRGGIADQERAISIYIRILGEGHPNVAATLYNLSTSYDDAGRYEDQLLSATRAKDIYVALQGPRGRDVGSCLSSVADAHGHLGEPANALSLHREALEILTASLGPQHIEVATELMSVGIALSQVEQYDESVGAFRKAAAAFTRELGPGHPFVANAKNGAANVLAVQGKRDEAQVLYEQILEQGEGDLPPGLESNVRANLAILLAEQHNYEGALAQYDQVLELSRDAPQSFGYQSSLVEKADVYHSMGRHDEALEIGEELLRTPSEDPTVVAAAQYLVARVLWETKGDRSRAHDLASQAESVYASVEGLSVQLSEVREWLDAHPRPTP
jgi:tetratricopeptide (TPR) repeat protein/tRNA A-37 threonylcarbamoyl transferase component Bud32